MNDDLDRLRLPELQARHQEVIGEPTRCPNRTFLIRRIRDSNASRPAKGYSKRASAKKPARRAKTAVKGPRGRFKDMTVEELQAEYARVVGRPTGSTDRRYLTWKIREAENGHVPIGPRETRTPDQEAHVDAKILPVRLGTAAVAKIDSVWRNAGMRSRTEFFRRALAHFLKHLGQRDAAALFA